MTERIIEGWKRLWQHGRYHYIRSGRSLCGVAERGEFPYLTRQAQEEAKPPQRLACTSCLRLNQQEGAYGR